VTGRVNEIYSDDQDKSSGRLYQSRYKAILIVNYGKTLGMIGGRSVEERRRRSERFVTGGIAKNMNI